MFFFYSSDEKTERECPKYANATYKMNPQCQCVPVDQRCPRCLAGTRCSNHLGYYTCEPIKPPMPPPCRQGSVYVADKCVIIKCKLKCPDGMKCKNNDYCVPAGCDKCEGACIENRCVAHPYVPCYQKCPPGEGVCVAGVCTRRNVPINCTRDYDCPDELPSCKMNECNKPWPPVYPLPCVFSWECKERYKEPKAVCYGNRCIKNPTYPLCYDKCPNKEVCENSICVKQPKLLCKKNNDCPKITPNCFHGRCHPTIPVGCDTNSDCPPDTPACVDGVCFPEIPVSCEKDIDCGNPAFIACLNKICRTRPEYPLQPIPACINNHFCTAPLVCIDGQCKEKLFKGSCKEHQDCKSNKMVCWRNICRPGVLIGCTSDPDCPSENPKCVDGLCMEQPPEICHTNTDCPTKDPICYNGVCSRVVPACKSEKDCPREASKCVDGQCLSRPEKPPKGCVKGCWRKSIDNLIFFANPHTYLSYLLKTNN